MAEGSNTVALADLVYFTHTCLHMHVLFCKVILQSGRRWPHIGLQVYGASCHWVVGAAFFFLLFFLFLLLLFSFLNEDGSDWKHYMLWVIFSESGFKKSAALSACSFTWSQNRHKSVGTNWKNSFNLSWSKSHKLVATGY